MMYDNMLNRLLEIQDEEWISYDEKLDGVEELPSLEELLRDDEEMTDNDHYYNA